MAKTVDEKFRIVIEKNTFYFFNRRFEENYEGYLNSIRETLLVCIFQSKTATIPDEIGHPTGANRPPLPGRLM